MKKRISILSFLLFVGCGISFAQPAYLNKKRSKKPTEADRFMQTQWWLGFKAGVNMTEASPDQRFSGLSPTNYDPGILDKEYDGFEAISGQAGIEITFYHKGFSFSFQPNYRRQQFGYSNSYEWTNTEDADNTLSLNYDQAHKLDYIELPLLVKYDILKQNKFRPFVQVGVFYATLMNAQKEVEISGIDQASGSAGPFENQQLIIGADDLFIKSSTGVMGGLGFYYDFWSVRLVFDATYRMGLNNITNTQNRFSENQLSGIGDAMDDVNLNNISFNLGCLFPMRFISSKIHNPVR